MLLICVKKNSYVWRENKNGKPCKKKAKFFKNDKYYCKICARDKKFKIPTPEFKNKKLKNLNLLWGEFATNKLNIKYDKKVKTELFDLVIENIDINYFNFIEKIQTKDFNLVTYGRNLKKLKNFLKIQRLIV